MPLRLLFPEQLNYQQPFYPILRSDLRPARAPEAVAQPDRRNIDGGVAVVGAPTTEPDEPFGTAPTDGRLIRLVVNVSEEMSRQSTACAFIKYSTAFIAQERSRRRTGAASMRTSASRLESGDHSALSSSGGSLA